MSDTMNKNTFEKKIAFTIDTKKEEERHKRTLSHFLDKIHETTGYQNKDVAEILNIDKGTYSKIRQTQIAPITNSIITLKRFAYLNDLNLIDFISKIEEIPAEVNESDWLASLNNIMLELGGLVRTELIHIRLSHILKNDPEYLENLRKCFVLLSLLIDLLKYEKWFDYCSNMILKVHDNLGIIKSKNLSALIARIKIGVKN